MSDLLKEKLQKQEKKAGKMPADGIRGKEKPGRTKEPVSTGFGSDEQGNPEEPTAAQIVNSHPLGPDKQFPVSAVTAIIEEEINNNLQEQKYEANRCQELTLTLCEGIRNRVKELLIPRYKIVVLVHIAQLYGQGMQISSRCLWDTSSDTFTSYSFKNSSLLCSATVYALYFE